MRACGAGIFFGYLTLGACGAYLRFTIYDLDYSAPAARGIFLGYLTPP